MDRYTLENLHLLQDFKVCPTIFGHYVLKDQNIFRYKSGYWGWVLNRRANMHV